MYRNSLTTYKHIYDMPAHMQADEVEDPHKCPRVIGPATNYTFRRMLPMYRFLDLVRGNSRSWLRLFDEKSEA